jgi:hypothetical protein
VPGRGVRLDYAVRLKIIESIKKPTQWSAFLSCTADYFVVAGAVVVVVSPATVVVVSAPVVVVSAPVVVVSAAVVVVSAAVVVVSAAGAASSFWPQAANARANREAINKFFFMNFPWKLNGFAMNNYR